jgi:hypothetical protein
VVKVVLVPFSHRHIVLAFITSRHTTNRSTLMRLPKADQPQTGERQAGSTGV